jgi:hypothetical protein
VVSSTRYRTDNPLRYRAQTLCDGLRKRCVKRGWLLPVELTVEYLERHIKDNPSCPICGVGYPMAVRVGRHGQAHRVPSIDRIDPHRPTYADNWTVICARCNRVKNDATAAEHRRVAEWMDSLARSPVDAPTRAADFCDPEASRH